MSGPWTDAHQREAQRRIYEIAAELVGADRGLDADMIAIRSVSTEKAFRANLGFAFAPQDAARIDREVRRVRALAEGRLVREPPVWRCVGIYAAEEDAIMWEGPERPPKRAREDRAVVRVTRIRRAR